MMEHFPSILAWAMLPVMSSLYIFLSKKMEALKLSAALETLPDRWPCQIFSILLSLLIILFHHGLDLYRETEEGDEACAVLLVVVAFSEGCNLLGVK